MAEVAAKWHNGSGSRRNAPDILGDMNEYQQEKQEKRRWKEVLRILDAGEPAHPGPAAEAARAAIGGELAKLKTHAGELERFVLTDVADMDYAELAKGHGYAFLLLCAIKSGKL